MRRHFRKVGLLARMGALSLGLLLNLGALGCQVAAPPDDARNAQVVNIDPEIASILRTVNDAELELAQLARLRATDDNVKELANTLVDRHGAAIERQETLFRDSGITPLDNTTSQQLRTETDKLFASLETLRGNAFDKAYLEAQIQTQTRVYSILDRQLIPRAQNEQLRGDLFRMSEEVGAQLRRAQELQAWSPPNSD